ncbi:MAG: type IV conjugative transfer system protein TraL [Proteobacteria bacterium]|jgi:conjugal transfer pilus assembly protein TraL|nr:type IV conjugative transfer system protein TraL [Pseudomonadota bacterium]
MNRNLEHYTIPSKLDMPERWLFWTIDEGIALVAPMLFGFIFGYYLTAIIVGIVLFLFWRKLKSSRHMNLAIYGTYWFFPEKFSGLKGTPSSDKRLFL